MRRVLAVLVAGALVAAVAAAPASARGGDNARGNVVEVALAASGGSVAFDRNPNDYDILVKAVIATGLDDDLAAAQRITVFAPNDLAFKRLVRDLTGSWPASEEAAFNTIAGSGANIPNILTYHVATKRLGVFGVLFSRSIQMLNGDDIGVRGITLVDDNDAFANPRLVVRALNIRASNGIIHTIDRVLLPATL
jgi:uncharacterized surface protein with fasciclin (FAS1) repeats